MGSKVIVIGAGPAGLTAAITIAEQGYSVLVIDEYMKSGGRLLGQLYEDPSGGWWNGIKESEKLYKRAAELGIEIKLQTAVSNIEVSDNSWTVHTDDKIYETSHLLLATGAAESPLPIKGWTLPGVMSVGAAQVMTNVHRVKPGERGVVIGVNVLSSAIAMELKMANVDISCITLPQLNTVNEKFGQPLEVMNSLLHVAHMAPSAFIKIGSKLMKNNYFKQLGITFFPKNGVKMWDIPIMLRKAAIEIIGDEEVEGVKVASISPSGEVIKGTEKIIPADFVCIAGGLYPLAELAALAGCPFHYIEELGGYVPLHSENMETVLPGLFVAGNITGIEGAKVAINQGKTAGLAIVNDLAGGTLLHEVHSSVKETELVRQNAYIQFHPAIEEGRQKLQQLWHEQVLAAAH